MGRIVRGLPGNMGKERPNAPTHCARDAGGGKRTLMVITQETGIDRRKNMIWNHQSSYWNRSEEKHLMSLSTRLPCAWLQLRGLCVRVLNQFLLLDAES